MHSSSAVLLSLMFNAEKTLTFLEAKKSMTKGPQYIWCLERTYLFCSQACFHTAPRPFIRGSSNDPLRLPEALPLHAIALGCGLQHRNMEWKAEERNTGDTTQRCFCWNKPSHLALLNFHFKNTMKNKRQIRLRWLERKQREEKKFILMSFTMNG